MQEQFTTNIDPQEIQKFSELAHQWWDPNGMLQTLHDMNPVRLQWIKGIAPMQGKTILDIGCGGGILSEAMAKEGAQHVTGIDLAEKSIRIAKLHAMESQLENLDYRLVSAEDFATTQSEKYDIITCMEMLEHVPHPASIVASISTMLKPGGWAFFSTINRNAKAWLTAIVGAEYVLQILPKGTHEYAKLIKPSELTKIARQNQLTPVHTQGLEYNPLTKRFKMRKDISVNYYLACKKAAVSAPTA